MNRSFPQRLIAILCLVAFGLGQTLFASMGVRCTDASGKTRIETACVKSSKGACVSSCVEVDIVSDESHEHDSADPTPCKDEPSSLQSSAVRLAWAKVSVEPVVAIVILAILGDHWLLEDNCPTRYVLDQRNRERPPDALSRLRSVILIV
jgi:hypothetical protein